MLILEEFESSSNKLERLLTTLLGSKSQDRPQTITLEWMQQVRELLDNVAPLLADPSLDKLKTLRQIHRYRNELAQLKEAVEQGQKQLMAQRSAIQNEQARLKKVRALTGTLESLQ
jgi:septal ring factor EnvC (AmiA/AmiB activator)